MIPLILEKIIKIFRDGKVQAYTFDYNCMFQYGMLHLGLWKEKDLIFSLIQKQDYMGLTLVGLFKRYEKLRIKR